MGALPSGNDPSYVSFPDNYHAFGAALSALAGWTQANVTAQQKAELQASPGWTGASATLFHSLDPTLPFPLAFAKALAESMLGSIIAASTIDDIFSALNAWSTAFENAIAAMNAWWARLLADLGIYLDLFHLTYPAGSPSDTKTTTISGVRTWYSSIADMLDLFGLVTSTGVPANPAADVGTAHQDLTGAVASGITGGPTGGAPNSTSVQTAVSGLTQSVAGLQSQVSALQAPSSGPTTLLRDNGQDSPGSGLGSAWTRTQAAAVNRDGSYGFTWQSSGAVRRTCVGIYNTPLATADQVATIVLNLVMDYNGFNPTGAPYAYGAPENWIILRADSPTSPTSWVGARIRYADVQFGYCSGGTITMLGSPTTFYAGASSSYTLFAGDTSSDYNYKLNSGGRTVASYTDSAHATSGTLSGRYPGQIWQSDAGNFTLSGTPIECIPAATSWLAYDASASVGSPMNFGWVTRLNTAGVSLNASGMLPYTFFDNAVSLGSGIALPTSGDAGLQVSQAGVYSFSWGLRQPSTANATDYWPGIAVNGTLVEVGPTFMYDGGGTLLTGGNFGMATAGLLCNGGDVISPMQLIGNFATSSGLAAAGGSFSGESSGARSYMKIAKIG